MDIDTKVKDRGLDKESLVGSNKMEILLFSLGTNETYGINVFKVREVSETPFITKTPNMPFGVEGLISLRGNVIPVISLGAVMGCGPVEASSRSMLVTEYSKKTMGFLVDSVDRIVRVDWANVHAADSVSNSMDAFVTAVTELPDGRLVSIVDVEKVLSSTFGEELIGKIDPVEDGHHYNVFFVDDSSVARRKIAEVLDKMGVRNRHAVNGLDAWDKLNAIAEHAQKSGEHIKESIDLILVDIEMPEMDGYVLTAKIKADKRFHGIPVVMHSSLSSNANKDMGKQAGVDAYVAKFDGDILADTIRPLLVKSHAAIND